MRGNDHQQQPESEKYELSRSPYGIWEKERCELESPNSSSGARDRGFAGARNWDSTI
jgi:hypothetical protein